MDPGAVPGLGRPVAQRNGYRVRFLAVGGDDPEVGPPTQLAVFDKTGRATGAARRHDARAAVPQLSLVVLIGVSGSGKSTFARERFKPTEVISSDFCRGLVADDENDQSATADAFELLHFIAGMRLAAGRLTVVDATNVQPRRAVSWSRWRATMTCCRRRSCWTCRRASAARATRAGPTATSAPT